jgi:hypothetical protein
MIGSAAMTFSEMWLGINKRTNYKFKEWKWDRLCGLVVRGPGYRSRGPGSIPGAIRFSEK